MFDTGEPHSGPDLVAALHRLDGAGESYLRSMPGEEFFAPQGAAWSPAEHVRHLAKSARPVARALAAPRIILAFRFGLHRGSSPSFAGLRERYLAALAAGAQAGRFAPSAKAAPADPEAGRSEIIAEWHAATGALGREVGRWSERSLDRYQLPHPVLGLLTVREMLAFTVYHTAHHLRRIAERRPAVTAQEGPHARG
jgi:hypothetical protein